MVYYIKKFSAATKRQRLYLKPDMRNSNLSQNNYDSDNLIESTSEMMDNEMVDSRLITETDITTSNINNICQLPTTTHSQPINLLVLISPIKIMK